MAALERAMARMTLSMPQSMRCRVCAARLAPFLAISTTTPSSKRTFSSTPANMSWLQPVRAHTSKDRKGRPRVPTGGSMRGTTVVWGDFGLRLLDHHQRISAMQLRNGEEAIKKRLRGLRFRFYSRVSANIAVYSSGNETRMGKGKGSFDFWATRVPVSKVIFEIQGNIHEQIVKDAFRLAGHKLPGKWEFVKRNDPPKMGKARVTTDAERSALERPRLKMPDPSSSHTADRLASGLNPVPPIDPSNMPKTTLGAGAHGIQP